MLLAPPWWDSCSPVAVAVAAAQPAEVAARAVHSLSSLGGFGPSPRAAPANSLSSSTASARCADSARLELRLPGGSLSCRSKAARDSAVLHNRASHRRLH